VVAILVELQTPPNHDVVPDRAAILVSRDTMPLQAARQVNAVVRRVSCGSNEKGVSTVFIVYARTLKSYRSFFLLLLIWFFYPGTGGQAQTKPDPKKGREKAAEIKTLLKERHKLLNMVVAHFMDQYKVGIVDFTQIAPAQRDLLRATLELEEDDEKRVGLLQQGERTAKEFVKIAEARFKLGARTEVDLLQAKVVLLEIQIELLRANAKVEPRK
jgi:hypothetical protein